MPMNGRVLTGDAEVLETVFEGERFLFLDEELRLFDRFKALSCTSPVLIGKRWLLSYLVNFYRSRSVSSCAVNSSQGREVASIGRPQSELSP